MNIKINEYKLPMDKSGPYGITVGPNGAMWFTESRGNKIGRITSKGEITEYLLPTLDAEPLIIAKGITELCGLQRLLLIKLVESL